MNITSRFTRVTVVVASAAALGLITIAAPAIAGSPNGGGTGAGAGGGKGHKSPSPTPTPTPPPPDPCTVLAGPANFAITSSATGTAVHELTTDAGEYNPGGARGDLCPGYTYTITVASAQGSSLGYVDLQSLTHGYTYAASADGTSVTFTFTPNGSNTTFQIAGDTTNYTDQASCGSTGVDITAFTTSPTGTMTPWNNGLPKPLCDGLGSGGNTYFG